MTEVLDLFGDPVIRRSAIFNGSNRIRLSRRWGPGPIAYVIGHNPAEASGEKDDATSRWWNNWFAHYGYGGYDAGNLYPFVTADPRECYRIVDNIPAGNWHDRDALHFVNLPEVVERAKAADQVFVCWGAIARDHDWIEHVIEEIQTGVEPWPDLWCWGKTKSGAPTHPMARGKHRIDPLQEPILWRAR